MAPTELDPVVSVPFQISRDAKVATAGSCFAQHISRHLRNSGFCFLITEPAHPILNEEEALSYHYGTFTARYGNIYTARQLLQLFKRAYGLFSPVENAWQGSDGQFIDPFRPTIQPGGFATFQEFEEDRRQHFRAVREALETLDVFVFTLGLTEAWESVADGAVFPLCPGVAGGEFNADKHRFHNFTVAEVVDDMLEFIGLLESVNPKAKLILTVSPVPLMATASSQQHVLLATSYSKSVLRVACEEIVRAQAQAAYFPSYEIITGSPLRGGYFAADCRAVTEAGVAHVMRVFFRHFAQASHPASGPEGAAHAGDGSVLSHLGEMEGLVQVECDEEMLR